MEKRKVLLVEDDMIIQMHLNKIVSDAGHQVIGEARDYEEILEILERERPELILMDVGIGGDKDGIEIAKILDEKYSIPLYFITGNSDKATIERAKKAKPMGFIFKPIDDEELLEKINS